jgi:uncharacterized protein YigE (DUF2233 family)
LKPAASAFRLRARFTNPVVKALALCLFVASYAVTGCAARETGRSPSPDYSPIPTPATATSHAAAPTDPAPAADTGSTEQRSELSPSPSPPSDTGWQTLKPGFERRTLSIYAAGIQVDSLYLVRIDPAYYDFSVGYSPGAPRSLRDWQQETGALLVVNGGFFTPGFRATGLIVVDGQPYGRNYRRPAGMLTVTESGPELRSLLQKPYDPAEPLRYALQSFPVLVRAGGAQGYDGNGREKARRTVVAADKQGNMLFLVSHWGSFTLSELSDYLLHSDLDLDMALNLDGGASTGMLLSDPEEGVPSFSLLPSVILVSPS